MKSVKAKILTLVLSCLLLSAAAIGGVSITNTKKVASTDSAQIMDLLSTVKADQLNQIFSKIELSVETLKSYVLRDFNGTDSLSIDDYSKKFTDIAVNVAENTKGASAVYMRFNPGISSAKSGFFYTLDERKDKFTEETPTDLNAYDPSDVEHVGWFYLPSYAGKAMWISPYYNQNIAVEIISYATPLYQNGEFLGEQSLKS